jgi:small subunit ribosomal protein S6
MSETKKFNCYETICIIKPDLNEDKLARVIEKYQLILAEKGAKGIVTQNRGRRHLKYTMKKFKDGIYVQINYEGNGEVIGSMEKTMKIDEDVLRFMTVRIHLKEKAEISI